MVTVRVKFHGVIRDVTGATSTEIEVRPNASVSELLEGLHARYGRAFFDRVLDDALGVKSYVRLYLNGQEVASDALATTLVTDGGDGAEAMLFVLPAMTGGCEAGLPVALREV